MGKKIQLIFLMLTLSFYAGKSAFAQELEEKVLASTIIQQQYVKFPWQESGGVFMIVVDAIAADAWSTYQRSAYFRYIDEKAYMNSIDKIAPDDCKESLHLNMDNVQQTVNTLNTVISAEGHCPALIYDAKLYQGFFHSQKEDQFNFEALKSYDSTHAYQLTDAAYSYVLQQLTLNNGMVSYKKIKDRYMAVRKSMNGEARETSFRVTRLIISGFIPLLKKTITFCDLKSDSTKNQWTRLKTKATNLIEQIGIAYGNSGEY